MGSAAHYQLLAQMPRFTEKRLQIALSSCYKYRLATQTAVEHLLVLRIYSRCMHLIIKTIECVNASVVLV